MIRLHILLGLIGAGCCVPAHAWEPARTGIVIVRDHNDRTIEPLASAMTKAGFIVDQPEIAASFDRLGDDTMEAIDAAALRVSNLGVTRLVLVGANVGGNAVLHYLTLERPADAALLLAPEVSQSMSLDLSKLGTGPVLWIHGTQDKADEYFANSVWPAIPDTVPKGKAEVTTDHPGVPEAAREIVIDWLRNRQ